jgi:glycosyltransferase involved in cell wall biosynthesis
MGQGQTVDDTAPAPAAARVSVVMPAYNAAATLVASMRSVLAQTHGEVELLVIDDCSTDATWELAREAAIHDPRVRPIRAQANGGVAAARNAGIEAATGSHVAFLDSDDRWHPQKLAIQLAAMAAQGAPVSYTAYERVSEQGAVLSTVRPPARVDHATMLKGNRIGNLTGMYSTGLGEMRFEKAGHEDYVFWLKLVRRAGLAICAGHPQPLAYYLVRAGSLSANKLRAAQWQWHIYREVEKIGPLASTWYFLNYAAGALGKRI